MSVLVLLPNHGRMREAVPVRALPRVAPDRLYAERIARELTQLDRPSESEILRHVQSYKLTEDGNITEVLPVEWLAILTDVLALSQELDDHLPPRCLDERGLAIPDPRHDRAYDDAVLGRLPKGVFVWWDEFERAYLKRLRRWPEQQQKDGKLVRDPLISPELRAVVMEGFERFFPQQAAVSAQPQPRPAEPAPDLAEPAKPETRAPLALGWRTAPGARGPEPGRPSDAPPSTADAAAHRKIKTLTTVAKKQARLGEILAAMLQNDEEFNKHNMPPVRGSNWKDGVSFLWFCAQIDPAFEVGREAMDGYRQEPHEHGSAAL